VRKRIRDDKGRFINNHIENHTDPENISLVKPEVELVLGLLTAMDRRLEQGEVTSVVIDLFKPTIKLMLSAMKAVDLQLNR